MAESGRAIAPSIRLALLDAVLSSVPIGIAVVDRDLRYVVVNDALAAMNGRAPDDHVGRTITEVLGDDVPALPAVRQVLDSGVAVVGLHAEATAPHLPDVVRRFSASFHPVREGEEVIGVACVVAEVTDPEQGLEVLRASELRYRTLVEATTSLVWQVRPGDSPRADWLERIHPDDRDRVSRAWQQAIETKSVFAEECRLSTPRGSIRHVAVRAVPVIEGTTVREWIGSSTDITAARRTEEALRESEARLRLALASGGTGTWDWDLSTGRITWSEETAAIFGMALEDFDGTWDAFAERVEPEDLARLEATLDVVVPGLGVFEDELRVHRLDGTTANVLARGQTFPGLDGAPAHVVGVAIDLTAQRRESDRVVQVLDSIADGFFALDREWRFTYVNARAEATMGQRREQVLGRCVWDAFPEYLGSDYERAFRRAVEREEVVEIETRHPARDVWFAIRAYPTTEGLSVYLRDITEERAAALERLRLQRLQEAASERTARLGEIAAALTDVTSPGDVARLVLIHAIAALDARGGAMALVDDAGALQWAAIEGYDAYGAGSLRESPLEVDRPLTRVVASRLPEFLSNREEMSREFPQVAHVLERLGDQAVCCLPLVAGGRCLGGITLTFREERSFGVEDRLLLAALTDFSAQALERARLYEREHRVAETLQRALLPDRLADAPRVRTAARYLPGTEGVAVGGDWYDVFALDAGRIGIVLGDVAGKGVGAATVMGRLRNALRAFATSIDGPAQVLSRLDDFAARFGADDLATVVYGVLDIGNGELRLSSAGHMPPLLVGADGSTVLLALEPDLPVGVATGDERREHRVRLRAGDGLVLYSDGLVESRSRSIDEGLAALESSSSALHLVDVEAGCSALVEQMVGGTGGDDDVAVLFLRWDGATAEGRCSIVLPPEVASARRARSLVTEELLRWGEGDLVETATLCVSEIVTNAVLHAGTPVQLDIELHPSTVRIEVRDGGAAPPERLDADVESVHGRGVAIVEVLSAAWGVEPSETGKCVWFELERATSAAS